MYFTKIFIILGLMLIAYNAKAQTTDHLDGTYNMDLNIDGQVFHDKLILKGVHRPIYFNYFNGAISGKVIVPYSFTSDLTGTINCSRFFQQCNIEFSIIAKENGKEYKVVYKVSIEGENFYKLDERPLRFEGDAFLEDGSLLGHFKAVRNE